MARYPVRGSASAGVETRAAICRRMDAATTALFVEMLRAGALDEDVVIGAADECEAAGDAMAAHELRCLIISAASTPATETAKKRRRAALRAIDGGNSG